MKKLILPLSLFFFILSCKAPTALLDKLEDDVKAANDLYLEILSISPDENQLFTNPGEEVRIEFDRAISLNDIEDYIKILDSDGEVFGIRSDIKSLAYDFDEASNILTIAANPYLDGLEQYSVEILEGVQGTDGSLLREGMSWSFTTNDDPRGYLEIVEEYSSDTVTVNLFSEGATFYALDTRIEAVEASTTWIAITSNPMTVNDVPIQHVNGPTSLFVKFRDGMINESRSANVSRIESATTIHDGEGPLISMSTTTLYANTVNSGVVVATASVSDPLSGVATNLWSRDSGPDNLSLSASDTLSCTITTVAADEESYTIKLTATDNVGNISTATRSLVMDMNRPVFPVVNRVTTATNPKDGTMYFTSDILPDYTFNPVTQADGGSYQYRIGKPNSKGTTSWSSWSIYSTTALKGAPVMSYGNDQQIEIRAVDDAGNPSSATQVDEYLIFPSKGISPANGESFIGDLVWAPVKSATYYKAYFGSSKSQSEVFIKPVLLGKIFIEGTPRVDPYVDTSEIVSGISPYATYYWYYVAYNGSTVIYDSRSSNRGYPFYFKTSLIKF